MRGEWTVMTAAVVAQARWGRQSEATAAEADVWCLCVLGWSVTAKVAVTLCAGMVSRHRKGDGCEHVPRHP